MISSSEVSGGQKQRAAVARALITQPQILLADEPTGALDSRAADSLLRIFEDVNKSGQTVFMVTHSTRAASHAGRVLFIKDGVIFHQLYRGNYNEEMYQKISDTLTVLATGRGGLTDEYTSFSSCIIFIPRLAGTNMKKNKSIYFPICVQAMMAGSLYVPNPLASWWWTAAWRVGDIMAMLVRISFMICILRVYHPVLY